MTLTTRHQCSSQRNRQNVYEDDKAKAYYTDDDENENDHAVALTNAPVGAGSTDTVADVDSLTVNWRGDTTTGADDV